MSNYKSVHTGTVIDNAISKTITMDKVSEFNDITNAVNKFKLSNSATGTALIIEPTGTDADVDINIKSKGAGVVKLNGAEPLSTSGTQTLINKTLTKPKINENVALTATATELNILDGATLSTTELNYLAGATSNIQTQFNSITLSATPIVLVTTNKTVIPTDVSTFQNCVSASDILITVPLDLAVGNYIEIGYFRYGTGKINFIGANGVTINSVGGKLSITSRYQSVVLKKMADNEYILFGALS